MIQLPSAYKDWVQVQPLVISSNQFLQSGVLVFIITNDSGQIWQQERPINIHGIIRAMNTEENYYKQLNIKLQEAFDIFLIDIRDNALAANKVLVVKDGKLDFGDNPLDDNWRPIWDDNLTRYAEYKII